MSKKLLKIIGSKIYHYRLGVYSKIPYCCVLWHMIWGWSQDSWILRVTGFDEANLRAKGLDVNGRIVNRDLWLLMRNKQQAGGGGSKIYMYCPKCLHTGYRQTLINGAPPLKYKLEKLFKSRGI